MTKYSVGIVGATGAVGQEMLEVLRNREFPFSEIRLFASARSAGKVIGGIEVEEFSGEKTRDLDFILLAVSGDFAREFAPQISAGRAVVIDNSSAFRLDPNIPLVVPEINPEAAHGAKLISNPNCTTAILTVALFPIHQHFGVKKCIVSTYQATSGAGAEGMAELMSETQNVLEGKTAGNSVFAHPIAFNLIPHIDVFQKNGYTKEEMKVALETRKIFGEPEMPISCTAVRIPTLRAHSESIVIETEKEISPEAVREILRKSAGVEVRDNPNEKLYPMPLTATRKEKVEVGRIRQSLIFGKHGLEFFVCGDQLLKGAALNAVQIAELFVEKE